MLDIDRKIPFDTPRKLGGWHPWWKSADEPKNKQEIDQFSKVNGMQVFPASIVWVAC